MQIEHQIDKCDGALVVALDSKTNVLEKFSPKRRLSEHPMSYLQPGHRPPYGPSAPQQSPYPGQYGMPPQQQQPHPGYQYPPHGRYPPPPAPPGPQVSSNFLKVYGTNF